jgi:hypothetical protein
MAISVSSPIARGSDESLRNICFHTDFGVHPPGPGEGGTPSPGWRELGSARGGAVPSAWIAAMPEKHKMKGVKEIVILVCS